MKLSKSHMNRTKGFSNSGSHLRMFVEDFASHLFIRNSNSCIALNSVVAHEEEVIRHAILPMLSQTERYVNDKYMRVFIEEIACQLVRSGFVCFQIGYQNTPVIQPINISRVSLFTKQTRNNIRKIFRQNPIEDYIKIEFPKELGGANKIMKFIREINRLDDEAPIYGASDGRHNDKQLYNVIYHQGLCDKYFWKITSSFNWDMRKSSGVNISPYYIMRRKLIFHQNTLIVRDAIIEKVKEIILAINKEYNYSLSLELSGIQSLTEVNEAIDKYQRGEMTLDDAFVVILGC